MSLKECLGLSVPGDYGALPEAPSAFGKGSNSSEKNLPRYGWSSSPDHLVTRGYEVPEKDRYRPANSNLFRSGWPYDYNSANVYGAMLKYPYRQAAFIRLTVSAMAIAGAPPDFSYSAACGRLLRGIMRKLFVALFASALLVATALAADTAAVIAPIHQFIDGFNSGDVKSAYAAYAAGQITIIDEFPPHRWAGLHAAQQWAADYDKHAAATGVTDGSVKYGAPTRSEVEGDAAYVVIPALYTYKERGQAVAEEGQMTFALHKEAGGWKIEGWTWTGVKPHPAK